MRTAGEETKPERMLSAFLSGAVAQFGRAPRSQCGGQGFDPPLLHHLFSIIYSHRQLWLFLSCDAVVTWDFIIKSHGFDGGTFVPLGASYIPSRHSNIRVAH